ncbi:MAG: hypothetical protein J6S10_02795 [Clostridia bacterium]|nr:hypothetical protein [Clostridia bacterium]MBO7250000.1 hypothetical protein [Clostridia bacterium]
MKNQEQTKLIVGIGSILAAVLAVALLMVGIFYSGALLTKVLIIVISVFVLALAGELGYLFMLFKSTKANYFLFNPKTNRNIAPQKLNFQIINARMNRYLSTFAASEGKLWMTGILENPELDMDQAFKPLVGYKLLFDLAERDFDAGWKCFDMATDQTVEFICVSIEANGETELANALREFKRNKPTNLKCVRDYLVTNRKYLQSKMFRYVVDNIDKF